MRVPFMFRPGYDLGDKKPSRARLLGGVAVGIAALAAVGYLLSLSIRKPMQPGGGDMVSRELRVQESEPKAPRSVTDVAKESSFPVAEGRPAGGTAATKTRKVAASHSMYVETTEFPTFYDRLVKMAPGAGGYNAEEGRSRGADGRMRGRVAMRLPPAEVEGVLRRIREQSDVVRESGTSEDLTEQYYDLEARLRNARSAETRLADIMRTRAGKVSEILEAEREMTRIRGDIESMESRKRAMDIRIDLVSVSVEVSEPEKSSPAARRLIAPVRTAFGEGLLLLALSVRYLIIVSLAALPWAAAAIIVARVLARRRKSVKGTLEPPK